MEKGPLSEVETQEKNYCEYWIRPVFQTCLNLERGKKHKSNIFLLEGKFYEQGGCCFICVYEVLLDDAHIETVSAPSASLPTVGLVYFFSDGV